MGVAQCFLDPLQVCLRAAGRSTTPRRSTGSSATRFRRSSCATATAPTQTRRGALRATKSSAQPCRRALLLHPRLKSVQQDMKNFVPIHGIITCPGSAASRFLRPVTFWTWDIHACMEHHLTSKECLNDLLQFIWCHHMCVDISLMSA